ncbi:DUF2975 domain-containing protein [Xylocopilactobacillus apicola]|uniref:DUF2975 domain-containing protein n=1 Tax=Xylocopilactobacillus apicola TaxID=2932184 RepID=A0AAU9D2Y1_9LACO|nr:DUF2975 domain-containing protein [Xylocopilactobacillus apicola]BDR59166.1 hypothetical protein XA3_16070 [Xylocopilactobacillus apicola]
MSKKVNSVLLSVLEIVTYVFSAIFAIATGALLFAGLEMVFDFGSFHTELLEDVLDKSSSTVADVFSLITAFLIVVGFLGVSIFVRRIVRNLKHEIYFTADNLKNIRWIMWDTAAFFFLDLLAKILFNIIHQKSMNISWTELFVVALVFLVIYVIYLVFKRGVELQEDSDSLI